MPRQPVVKLYAGEGEYIATNNVPTQVALHEKLDITLNISFSLHTSLTPSFFFMPPSSAPLAPNCLPLRLNYALLVTFPGHLSSAFGCHNDTAYSY